MAKLYFPALAFVLGSGFYNYLEFDRQINYRFTQAIVEKVSLQGCDIDNEKWYVVFRREIKMRGVNCELAEFMQSYDPDLRGGKISYDQTVDVRYVDPVDGQKKLKSFHPRDERFVVPVGGRILILTHKSQAGEASFWHWTEDLRREAENGA